MNNDSLFEDFGADNAPAGPGARPTPFRAGSRSPRRPSPEPEQPETQDEGKTGNDNPENRAANIATAMTKKSRDLPRAEKGTINAVEDDRPASASLRLSPGEPVHGAALRNRAAPRRPGRPERSVEQKMAQEARRAEFGMLLQHLRMQAGLSLTEISRMAGLSAGNQARSYEMRCFPPGWVVPRYAEILGISSRDLGLALLFYSDPDLYLALTGTNAPPSLVASLSLAGGQDA